MLHDGKFIGAYKQQDYRLKLAQAGAPNTIASNADFPKLIGLTQFVSAHQRLRISILKMYVLCLLLPPDVAGARCEETNDEASYGRMDRFGFPRTKAKQFKRVLDFQTGDMVKAIVPMGKKAGVHTGCIAIRTSGSFNLKSGNVTIQGISYQYCRLLQLASGYNYQEVGGTALP